MIGITFAFLFHSLCISILTSLYLKIFSFSLSLTYQSIGTAASIIVVVRFVLSLTTISGLHSGITMSVRLSNSHSTLISLFSFTGSG